ncbi:MAG TPA: cysteine hydrolase family protein [Burkholderiales bacterium]|nr:cysteine hydrolase family protein [Burkholderiales bacterium]
MFDTALIVIGMQRDYLPGGRRELAGMDRAVERAALLVAMFRTAGMPVIHVRHVGQDPAAGFLLEGTPGVEIDPRVAPQGEDMLITKRYPNAFRDTTLPKILHVLGAKELFFCGAMTNLCIDATVRAAFDMGYRCTVVDDACAASELIHGATIVPAEQVQAAFMAALASACGEVVDLGTLSDRLAQA